MQTIKTARERAQQLTLARIAFERSLYEQSEPEAPVAAPDAPEEEPTAPEHWEAWLRLLFPQHTRYPFAPHQQGFWRWIWSIKRAEYQRPLVCVWPRGGAKSTSAELGVAALAARGARRYALYVCSNEPRAIQHVGNVAQMLGSAEFERYYPEVANRLVSKYGASLGWSRQRLHTRSGFTLDAIGLEMAIRGVKEGDARPDLIVLDDIDELFDSTESLKKKIARLTQSLLPSMSEDGVVLVVQNMIHKESIVAQLTDGRADFLADRIVSGPLPALIHPAYDQREGKSLITAGTPVWEGQSLEICQRYVTKYGLNSFRIECQHEVGLSELSMFGKIAFQHCTVAEVPILDRIETWVDPAVSDTDSSDSNGIQIDGAKGDVLYRLWSWEHRSSPEETIKLAILKSLEIGAEAIGFETDQGGDTWRPAYNGVWDEMLRDPDCPEVTVHTRKPLFKSEKASRLTDESEKGLGVGFASKSSRGQQMLVGYQTGHIMHVVNPEGTHETLENALRRFLIRKPYDLTDACYWAWRSLARPRGGVY